MACWHRRILKRVMAEVARRISDGLKGQMPGEASHEAK